MSNRDTLLKEEQIKCLDACMIGVGRYQYSGSIMQTIQLEGVLQLLLHMREELSVGTSFEGRFCTFEELKSFAQPSAEAVADEIIKDLYNEHH